MFDKSLFQKIFFKKRYQQIIDAENGMSPYFHQDTKQKDKLSIAFCISGHMRDYTRLKQNYKDFKNLLSRYGIVDVFIATWNKQNTLNCWSGAHGLSERGSHEIDIKFDDLQNYFETKFIDINDYAFYASEFSPLQYNNLTKNNYNWDQRGIYNGVLGSSKMFYLIYKANLLKLQQEYINGYEYDWVFRLRPDMLFDIKLCDIVLKIDTLDNQKLYIPGGPNNDKVAFGGSKIMNKYSNLLFKMIKTFDNNIFGPPEQITGNILVDLLDRENIVDTPQYGKLIAEHKHSLLPLR